MPSAVDSNEETESQVIRTDENPRVHRLSRDINRAVRIGDDAQATRLMDEQLGEVMRGLTVAEFTQQPGDPLLWHDSMRGANEHVAMKAQALQFARQAVMTGEILKQNDWSGISAYGDNIVKQFKDRNKRQLLKEHPGMSMEERAAVADQLVPIQLDPNEVSTYRQRLVKLDQQLKAVGSSVYTDPRTSRIARIISTETEPASPGYGVSREQDIIGHMPLHEKMLMPIREATEAFVGTVAQTGYGAARALEGLGVISLDAMTGGNAAAHYNGPTAWVQDSDGSWYHNGGKVGAAELYAGVWHLLTGKLVDQQMADYANTAAVAEMNQVGIRQLTTGIAHFLGSTTAFIASGGPAMRGGQMAAKGLGWLVTGGRAAASLPRAKRIVSALGLVGSAAGLGAYEAVNNGHIEGYGAAFVNGAIMAAPLMLIGQLGRNTERLLKRTGKMPDRIAATMAGAVEGAAFAGMDWKPVWNFIQDPNSETRAELVKHVVINMVGMAGLKAAGAPTPGDLANLRLPDRGLLESHAQQQATATAEAGKRPKVAAMATAEMQETESQIRQQQTSLDEPYHEAEGKRFNTAQQLAEMERADMPTRVEQAEGLLTEGPFKSIREQARIEREARTKPTTPKEGDQPREMPSEATRKEVEGKFPAERAAFEESVKPSREEFQKSSEQKLEEFLETGPDPLDAKIFRSLPEELQLNLARTSDARARRKLVLEYQSGEAKTKFMAERGIVAGHERKKMMAEMEAEAAAEEAPKESAQVTEEEIDFLMKDESKEPDEHETRVMLGKIHRLFTERQKLIDSDKRDDPRYLEAAKEIDELSKKLPDNEQTRKSLLSGFEGPEGESLHLPSPPPDKRANQPASLRMKPHLETEGIEGTPMTRASDVILDLQGFQGDPVRVPIREGVRKPFSKGVLGFFSRVEEMIRLRHERDTIASVHEWAHAMDSAVHGDVGGFRKLNKKEMQSFLNAARQWYPGFDQLTPQFQRAEAWAEFWSRHMLDDPTLRDDTSPAYDKLMAWMAAPEQTAVRNQMQRSQQTLRNYRDQGSLGRGRASIVMSDDPKSIQELRAEGIMEDALPHKAAGAVRKVFRVLNQQMVADNAGMKRAMREGMEVAKGSQEAGDKAIAETPIQDNPVRLFDALRMTANKIAERFILHGTHDLEGNVSGEGLKKIFDDIGADKHDDFLNYLNAKRNLEVHEKGLETLLDPQDYRVIVERLDSESFKQGAKRIREWSDRLIDYATEGGLFSREQAKEIKTSYQTYIPFFRVMFNRARRHAPGRGVAERGTGVKELHGADLEIKDPVDALGDMARSIITKTQQNMVMKSMVKFGLRHGATGALISRVERDIIPDTHPIKEIMKALDEASKSNPDVNLTLKHISDRFDDMMQAGEIGGSITMFSQAVMPKGSKPIIAFTPHFSPAEIRSLPTLRAKAEAIRLHGKLQWYEVNVDVYDMLMGVDQPQTIIDKMPSFVKAAIDIPSKTLRAGATVLAPGFVLRNMVRDTATFYLYSEEGMPFGIFSAAGKAISSAFEVIKGSPDVELFENLGGKGTTYFAGEIAAGRTAAELLGRERSFKNSLKHAYGKLADMLGTGEEVLRFRAFKTARDKALADKKSVFEANLLGMESAKEITANFTRAGTLARVLNRMVPYFTASIAGSARFVKTIGGAYGKEAQTRALVRGMVGIGLPAMALWWLNHDKKWFRELPDYERFNFLHIDLGLGNPIRIPLPFEVGKVFAKIPEMILDQANHDDPIGVADTMKDVVYSFVPSQWMPSIIRPFVEGASNHDFFTGKEIVPAWMKETRMTANQMTAYTRWYGRMVAQALGFVGYDVSPMMAEHQIDRFTGGIVGRTEDMAMTMAQLAGAVDEEYSPSRLPLAGSFLTEPFRQSKSVDKLFKFSAQVEQRIGSERAAGRHPSAQDHQLHLRLQRAKESISSLMDRARDGTMDRSEANERASDIARKFPEVMKFRP